MEEIILLLTGLSPFKFSSVSKKSLDIQIKRNCLKLKMKKKEDLFSKDT